MECGIVGPPLSGKSTLFSILTGIESEQTGHREVRHGISKLNDPRLDILANVSHSRKIVPATVEYVDIPGVVMQDGRRELYPAAYLAALRSVEMLALVVRAFDNPLIPSPSGSVNPLRDITGATLEFIVNDLITVERRLEKLTKTNTAESRKEADLLERCQTELENDRALRELDFTPEEEKILRSFSFLSLKPLLIVLNISEESVGEADRLLKQLSDESHLDHRVGWVSVAAEIEAEIIRLNPEDRELFSADLGFERPTLDRIIHATFDLLGMITFLTTGDEETRAWPIPAVSTAVQAAAVIHNDLARGFIRAEVCRWDELAEANGSVAKLREAGKYRLEGKDYIVKEGDTLYIRFNV